MKGKTETDSKDRNDREGEEMNYGAERYFRLRSHTSARSMNWP